MEQIQADFIKRKDFLKRMGLSASAIVATYCLGGLATSCKSDNTTAGDVDFTLDLTSSAASSLSSVGGWLKTNGVVIAHVDTDTYVAVTQVCSHEGKSKVTYRASNEDFYCTEHGARFDLNGKGLNSNGSKGIHVYNTSIDGDILRVYS